MKSWIPITLLFGVVLLISHAIAQSSPAGPAQDSRGRFQVATSPAATVLVDSDTGQTWLLEKSRVDRNQVWIPVQRLDEEQTERWLQEDSARLEQLFK